MPGISSFFKHLVGPDSDSTDIDSQGADTLHHSAPKPKNPTNELATLANGCFWGTENYMRKQFKEAMTDGYVGYTGGNVKKPTYAQVCMGNTGHAEAYQFEFDPKVAKYEDIVEYFFRMHDPTTLNRQGNDSGPQYRSAIFYHSDEQKAIAERVRAKVQEERYPSKKIVTEISPASEFWVAEKSHQRYLERNPGGYCNHFLRW